MGTINYQSLTAIWLNILKRQNQAIARKAEMTSKTPNRDLFEDAPPRRPNEHALDSLTDLLTRVR